jgi:drug/metabolite transporter (DMT)-like permease
VCLACTIPYRLSHAAGAPGQPSCSNEIRPTCIWQPPGGVELLAGVLSVGGYLIFLSAAKVLPLALVAALRESSLIFGTVIGAVLLKEPFGLRRVAAAGLVISGVLALSAGALWFAPGIPGWRSAVSRKI